MSAGTAHLAGLLWGDESGELSNEPMSISSLFTPPSRWPYCAIFLALADLLGCASCTRGTDQTTTSLTRLMRKRLLGQAQVRRQTALERNELGVKYISRHYRLSDVSGKDTGRRATARVSLEAAYSPSILARASRSCSRIQAKSPLPRSTPPYHVTSMGVKKMQPP